MHNLVVQRKLGSRQAHRAHETFASWVRGLAASAGGCLIAAESKPPQKKLHLLVSSSKRRK